MMISNVKGKFSGLSGILSLDEANVAVAYAAAKAGPRQLTVIRPNGR